MVIQHSWVPHASGDNPLPQEQTNETPPLLAVVAVAVVVALGEERCLGEGKTRPDHNGEIYF